MCSDVLGLLVSVAPGRQGGGRTYLKQKKKEISTKGHEERRRATKALRLTATGYHAREGMVDFRLFHSRMIRPAGRGDGLSGTPLFRRVEAAHCMERGLGQNPMPLTATCCRRLRGSTLREQVVHGLTPTAKCCRRLGGCLEPRADAREMIIEISIPRPSSVLTSERAAKPRLTQVWGASLSYRPSL